MNASVAAHRHTQIAGRPSIRGAGNPTRATKLAGAAVCAALTLYSGWTQACSPKPVTKSEALALALLTPNALATKRNGAVLGSKYGDISYDASDKMEYGKRIVKVFFKNDVTEGGSNLVGWYAVDRRTALVTNAMPDFDPTPFGNPELAAAQTVLRRRNCIKP
jgi:hypothetical protein